MDCGPVQSVDCTVFFPEFVEEDSPQVSSVAYDATGEFIAVGTHGGRIVVLRNLGGDELDEANYGVYANFQSHLAEFDYLKSLEIEEKINCIAFCRQRTSAPLLLAANEKTIKLWRVTEDMVGETLRESSLEAAGLDFAEDGLGMGDEFLSSPLTRPVQPGLEDGLEDLQPPGAEAEAALTLELVEPTPAFLPKPPSPPIDVGAESLRLPAPRRHRQRSAQRCQGAWRTFGHAHAFHVHSIGLSSDGETFISADDLRIHLWNLEVSSHVFNVVDIKPENMEDLTEVITVADCHPLDCSVFAYGTSVGTVKVADTRQSAICDHHVTVFATPPSDPGDFYSEIVSSVADLKFSSDGRFFVTRDFFTVKLWDLRQQQGPISTLPVHDHLRMSLRQMYDNSAIFDKFRCAMGRNPTRVLTGSYSGTFKSIDFSTGFESCHRGGQKGFFSQGGGIDGGEDFLDKSLHLAWHPRRQDTVCMAHGSAVHIHKIL